MTTRGRNGISQPRLTSVAASLAAALTLAGCASISVNGVGVGGSSGGVSLPGGGSSGGGGQSGGAQSGGGSQGGGGGGGLPGGGASGGGASGGRIARRFVRRRRWWRIGRRLTGWCIRRRSLGRWVLPVAAVLPVVAAAEVVAVSKVSAVKVPAVLAVLAVLVVPMVVLAVPEAVLAAVVRAAAVSRESAGKFPAVEPVARAVPVNSPASQPRNGNAVSKVNWKSPSAVSTRNWRMSNVRSPRSAATPRVSVAAVPAAVSVWGNRVAFRGAAKERTDLPAAAVPRRPHPFPIWRTMRSRVALPTIFRFSSAKTSLQSSCAKPRWLKTTRCCANAFGTSTVSTTDFDRSVA